VKNLALEAVQAVAGLARQKTVVLSVTGSGKAIVDRDRCLQIFINLLDNAVRHSPSGSQVRLSISQEREGCAVVVRDQGPGFAQLVRRTLGQPFTRTADGQIGLGLALSKLLVEAHGGSLKIAGRKGSGMVCVTFPNRKLR
jgi:two-component system sensor histidine kinase ResE